MEHIVQFGISIDDEAIKQNIERKATEEMAKKINEMIFESFGCYANQTNTTKRANVKEKVMERLEHFLEEHKDDIIESASDKLAERLSKTKKAKEMLEESIEKIMN